MCRVCGYRRPQTHQLSHALSLAIPTSNSPSRSMSIYNCLDQYFSREQLSGVNCAHCSLTTYKAKMSSSEIHDALFSSFYENDDKLFDALGPAYTIKTTATKGLSLSRFPGMLCLHLIRRVYDYVSGNMLKVATSVSFPMVLDMAKYFSFSTSQTRDVSYRLVSVVMHIGNANAGHYVNYTWVKGNEWCYCSDQTLYRVKAEEVLACQAYMLIYQRQ